MLSVAAFSSSEDEEYTTAEMNGIRRQLREQSNVFAMPDSKFVRYFRINKEGFKYVLDKIGSKLKEPTRSTCVPNMLKLAATMRILAEGSYQKGAGNEYNISMSQPSVSNAFQECIDPMYNVLCPEWISFPTEENEKYEFKVCDHKLRIRYISSHHQGSVHDSLVWNTSDLKQFLRDQYDNGERNTWLLGDAGYPLEQFLITPFRSAVEGSSESRFNYIHARTRNIVERSIGVLKNRFRCILGARQLHYTPDTAARITSVCAALHNICIQYKTEIPQIDVMDELPSTNSVADDDLNAINIRSSIMQSLNI